MAHPALTAAVGLLSGVLAGAFGIGGGLLTTPAIRLLLGFPALAAVGTPLPVIVPAALAGAVGYHKRGLVDVRAAGVLGGVGAASSILGAWSTEYAGGSVVMLVTAALIGWVALQMATRPSSDSGTSPSEGRGSEGPAAVWRLIGIGLAAGLCSGFLGLGGGFVVVPALSRWLRWPLKRAIGTSLATIALLAVPGSVTHHVLGNVDLRLALLLAAGAVPGAAIGARLSAAASERRLSLGFAAFLGLAAVALACSELAGLLA